MIRRAFKRLATVAACVAALAECTPADAQNEFIVSQYVHNRYVINPGFAGCRAGMSVLGSFRSQWAGIENTPKSFVLAANAPMRNEKLTAGLNVFGQHIHQSTNAGIMATVGYRTQLKDKCWLGLALQPGAMFRSTDWGAVRTMDSQDAVFMEKQTGVAPSLGFGAAFYGPLFFAGASVQSLIVSNDFDRRDGKFAPGDATYIITGGYLFNVSEAIALQPSAMVDLSKVNGSAADLTVSAIYGDRIWLDLAYRTTKDMTIGAAYKPNPRFKIAYAYNFSVGDLNGYGSGSHDISLQYDLVYHIKTVGPRFY